MTRTFTPLAALLAAALLSSTALAAGGKQCQGTAAKAYAHANHAMHQGMNIRYSGDADVDFARGMIPHHQGAVDMAEIQLKHGKDEQLKTLARRIIIWQEAEIGIMKQWLNGRNTGGDRKNLAAMQGYIEAMERMHRAMNIDYSGDADIDFARGMIPHHQGAIDMAWVLKKYGKSPLLRNMADEIIRSQSQEIALMQAWLDTHPAPKPAHKKQQNNKKKKAASHGSHTHH